MKTIKIIGTILILLLNLGCLDEIPDYKYIDLSIHQGDPFDSSYISLGSFEIDLKNPISLDKADKYELSFKADSVRIITTCDEAYDSTARLIFFFKNTSMNEFFILKNNENLKLDKKRYGTYNFDGKLYIFSLEGKGENRANLVKVNIKINNTNKRFNISPINHILEFDYAFHVNYFELFPDTSLSSIHFEFRGDGYDRAYYPVFFENNNGSWNLHFLTLYYMAYFDGYTFKNYKGEINSDYYVLMLDD